MEHESGERSSVDFPEALQIDFELLKHPRFQELNADNCCVD